MPVKPLSAPWVAPLSEFLANPHAVLREGGAAPVAVLYENLPLFYVLSPQGWAALGPQAASLTVPSSLAPKPAAAAGFDRFTALAEQLYRAEQQRAERGDVSRAAVGIVRNRLQAHVLPFFADVPPSQVTAEVLERFVDRLSRAGLSGTTVSQYLVVVRKLLRLAVRQGLLRELPEMPSVRIVQRPRAMLAVHEYAAVVRAAHRLAREGVPVPQRKWGEGSRERFWVAPKHLRLPRDMAWAIRFMVNSFIRPGDLRHLRHKHVQVCRQGEQLYLRLTLPETKRHDAPMVTLRPAVQVYEALLAQAQAQGLGGPEDHVFLPGVKDRVYALAVLGYWFKWVLDEAGVASLDTWGRPRTLYCLRHTAIMYRLLYGQGIDMLTLARNARTSVQMIERFYASALSGEMNVDLLQSRRRGGRGGAALGAQV